MRFLLILFIILPILEVWVLLRVGGAIGGFSTIALIIITAVIGVTLLRQQSFRTLSSARAKLERGEAPAGEMAEGLVIAVGGALLLTPGFITDSLGFCCLIPPVRRSLLHWALRRSLGGQASVVRTRTYHRESDTDSTHTIEGEYQREDEPRR